MKLLALLGAGLLASGTLVAAAAPTAAEAQRYGWNDRGYGHGYGHDRYRGYGRHRGWRGDRWHRGGRRAYGYRDGYRRGRVICRVHRSYDGPVRTCFRR